MIATVLYCLISNSGIKAACLCMKVLFSRVIGIVWAVHLQGAISFNAIILPSAWNTVLPEELHEIGVELHEQLQGFPPLTFEAQDGFQVACPPRTWHPVAKNPLHPGHCQSDSFSVKERGSQGPGSERYLSTCLTLANCN